jgi:hypothetical protein
MISALLMKELRFLARERCFRVIGFGYLLAVSAACVLFVRDALAFAGSDPARPLTTFFPALAGLQAALLAGITPWVILRMGSSEDGECLHQSIARACAPPWLPVFARMAAACIYVALLSALALPVLTSTWLLGAADYGDIALTLADTGAMLVLIALIVFHLALRGREWTVAWILSYITAAAVFLAWLAASQALGPASSSLVSLMCAVILGTLLIFRANRILLRLET